MTTTKEVCKVCGAPMNSAICHQCGWTPVLLPAWVPKSIRDFESERIAVAKEIIKEKEMYISQEKALQEKLQNLNSISSQLSDARDELKKKESALKAAESSSAKNLREVERLKADLKKYEIDINNVGVEQRKQLSQLQSQLSTAIHEKEELKRQIKDEQCEHNKTKQQIKLLEEKIKNLSSSSKNTDNQTQQPCPRTLGKPKATIGVVGQKSATILDLYEGDNYIISPQNIEVSFIGQLFRISIEDSTCTLYDLCGQTKKANGRMVRSEGDLLFDGDIFSIESIKCIFNFTD